MGTVPALVAGFAVVLGHVYSPFLRGKGGKGVACALGTVLAVEPFVALAAVVVFAVTKTLVPFVGEASVVAVLLDRRARGAGRGGDRARDHGDRRRVARPHRRARPVAAPAQHRRLGPPPALTSGAVLGRPHGGGRRGRRPQVLGGSGCWRSTCLASVHAPSTSPRAALAARDGPAAGAARGVRPDGPRAEARRGRRRRSTVDRLAGVDRRRRPLDQPVVAGCCRRTAAPTSTGYRRSPRTTSTDAR